MAANLKRRDGPLVRACFQRKRATSAKRRPPQRAYGDGMSLVHCQGQQQRHKHAMSCQESASCHAFEPPQGGRVERKMKNDSTVPVATVLSFFIFFQLLDWAIGPIHNAVILVPHILSFNPFPPKLSLHIPSRHAELQTSAR
jgi:hypothetical protein